MGLSGLGSASSLTTERRLMDFIILAVKTAVLSLAGIGIMFIGVFITTVIIKTLTLFIVSALGEKQ